MGQAERGHAEVHHRIGCDDCCAVNVCVDFGAVSSNRDEFSARVKRTLADRAGFRCSKPSCRALTVGPSFEDSSGQVNIGVAAHITAAASKGPRYDPSLSSEERSAVTNGIWLCQSHAKEIDDDPLTYDVGVLRTWKKQVEEDARALLGRPILKQALNVVLKITLHRLPDDALAVIGTTNLPDETKLMIDLYPSAVSEEGGCLGQAKATVQDGMFFAAGFTNREEPHPHAWFTVETVAYFNDAWRQPAQVVEISGKDGAFLKGPFAEPIHPEFPEVGQRIKARFSCVAPPLKDAIKLQKSDLQRAIEMVQEAVLDIDGSLATKAVREIVADRWRFKDFNPRGEWQARVLPNGGVIVSLLYWKGDTPATAEWHVLLASGEVRYWNFDGKWMSSYFGP